MGLLHFEPVQLVVATIASREECDQVVALLQQQRIPVVVHTVPSEAGSAFQLRVQPLFIERARRMIESLFGSDRAQLLFENRTMLWVTVLFFFIFPILLLLFPYERDPMNLAILCVIAILPGIFIGQKKCFYYCSICRAHADHGTKECRVCKRQFD